MTIRASRSVGRPHGRRPLSGGAKEVLNVYRDACDSERQNPVSLCRGVYARPYTSLVTSIGGPLVVTVFIPEFQPAVMVTSAPCQLESR